jgi:hypothetical protein
MIKKKKKKKKAFLRVRGEYPIDEGVVEADIVVMKGEGGADPVARDDLRAVGVLHLYGHRSEAVLEYVHLPPALEGARSEHFVVLLRESQVIHP